LWDLGLKGRNTIAQGVSPVPENKKKPRALEGRNKHSNLILQVIFEQYHSIVMAFAGILEQTGYFSQ
jgi:hypothetical protein